MKKIIGILALTLSCQAMAAHVVVANSIDFVYQLDSDATIFEFSAPVANSCGSTLYRVKSPNVDVANRKFSIVLTAFAANKPLQFADMESCEGDRAVAGWVKIVR